MDIPRLLDAPMDRGDNQLEHKTEVLGGSTDRVRTVKTLVVKKKRRRRDKNQRDGDNSLLLNLTLDVNDLRQQVHDCIVQKSLWETRQLVAREQFHARSLQSVGHFFRLFRHGYPAILTAIEKRFLSELVDENIAVGGGVRGRAQFLEQWRRYKQLFSVRRLRNFSVRVASSDAGGCLIECCGEFEGRVTAAALETVFPHVLGDAALVEQLLHRPFVCPTRTLISIDARGCLVQYDAFSDVFEAMSKLLDSNPVRVMQLMADAAISEGSLLPPVDGSIVDVEDVQQESGNTSPASSTTSRSSIDFILS
ncbi:hypothetical protein KRP22_006419 [Phytophthora ramorum]|uniref:uncharacterized protein n=1 Tax=Phytophthora ramorum TaxID=164328 RepID=UPI00309A5931|nr:hypothetical protein KRP23_4310 [Phytophthora ramorum]KAH7507348.1 hypothetical protein KRP22_2450 [Phytophthora ramorum]